MENEKTEDEIVITYETLFDILRREKSKEELQKLHNSFFEDVVNYINEKKEILERKEGQESLFFDSEKEKVSTQLRNVRNILRELYDKRERKIIEMAINKARTDNNLIDTSTLLEEEKELFENLSKVLKKHRERVLPNIINGKMPIDYKEGMEEKEVKEFKEEKEVKTIRFLNAVPRFVGPELKEYGPYEEDDVASLPKEVADVLIKKGRAEEIE